MHFSQCRASFGRSEISFYRGGQWQKGVRGNFASFDRFVSNRTFGLTKRVFIVDESNRIPEDVEAVMVLGDSTVYLCEAENVDISHGVVGYSYQFRRSNRNAIIVSYTTQNSASGYNQGKVAVQSREYPADVEFEGTSRAEFSQSRDDRFKISMWRGAPVNSDCDLLIEDAYYDIRSVTQTVDVLNLDCIRRS